MALNEGLVLNGVDLNPGPGGGYTLESLDMTPPKKKPEWAQGADSDGADLIRTPLFENRTVTAKVRIEPQTTMDIALVKLAAIIDQLQEAEKNPNGTPLIWTPSQATKKVTFYVLTGEVTGLPLEMQGDMAGWFIKAPLLTFTLTCKPFGYGEEVSGSAAIANTTGLSIVTLTVPTVEGDVPAEGRLVVKDTAAIGRRYVEWGLENRYYNAATSLVLDSEDMTPKAGAQSAALNAAGAYKRAGAVNGSILTTLAPAWTSCCSTGNLGHIGTFRVKARIQANVGSESTLSNVHVRLNWQDGEGAFHPNDAVSPVIAGMLSEVDLGIVNITPAVTGTQKWSGTIEAFSEGLVGEDALHVDYLLFIPVLEGYGKARGIAPTSEYSLIATDNFTTGTLSGNLGARTAPIGGAWTTSGAATDFTVESRSAKRATTGDTERRFAVLGTAQTDMQVNVAMVQEAFQDKREQAVIARWVNSTNYAYFTVIQRKVGTIQATELQLAVVVAGVTTLISSEIIASEVIHKPYPSGLALRVGSDGSITGIALGPEGTVIATISGSHASLKTGGALASGKGGYFDKNPSATAGARRLQELIVYSIPSPAYCIQASRTMEARSDSTITSNAAGTFFGPVPLYRGSRFLVPQDGAANRTSRIIVKADRNDLETADQQTIADAFTAEVKVTPRYHAIPR